MTFYNPSLVTSLVLAMAAIIIVQTALLLLAIFHLRKSLHQLDYLMIILSEKSATALDFAHRVVAVIEASTRKLPEIENTVKATVGSIVEATRKTNQAIAHRVEFLRSQLDDVGREMDTIVSKFSQQTFKVHRAVLDPSMRLSAILRAGIAVLKQLLSREDGSSASHSTDKEIST